MATTDAIDWTRLDAIADRYGEGAPRGRDLTWARAKGFAVTMLPRVHTATETDRLARILLERYGPEEDRATWRDTQRRWLRAAP